MVLDARESPAARSALWQRPPSGPRALMDMRNEFPAKCSGPSSPHSPMGLATHPSPLTDPPGARGRAHCIIWVEIDLLSLSPQNLMRHPSLLPSSSATSIVFLFTLVTTNVGRGPSGGLPAKTSETTKRSGLSLIEIPPQPPEGVE
jgi:hypothetical protein